MDNPIDNIGENEKLLRASKDFQKLGEGKKRRSFLKEAQRKDGTYIAVKTQKQIEEERIREEEIKERLIELEKVKHFERPEGMSDEEYTRKIVEMEAEICGIAPAGPRLNGPITGQIGSNFYGPTTPVVKTGPRGGKYTLGRTKNGRPYRRYF